jgi:hypothetical protein
MKRRSVLYAAGLAPLAAALLPAVFRAQPGSPQPSSPQPPQDYPEWRAAIHHLEQAWEDIRHLTEGYHGHHAKAIEHIDQALKECHRAIEEGR